MSVGTFIHMRTHSNTYSYTHSRTVYLYTYTHTYILTYILILTTRTKFKGHTMLYGISMRTVPSASSIKLLKCRQLKTGYHFSSYFTSIMITFKIKVHSFSMQLQKVRFVEK